MASAQTEKDESSAARQGSREADQTLTEFFSSLSGLPEFQLKINRMKPAVYRGRPIKGHLETVSEPLTEDDLRERFGGGTYQIIAQKRGVNGNWVHAGSKSIDISGEPQLLPQDEEFAAPMASAPVYEDNRVVGKAMDMSEKMRQEALEEARRAREEARNGGGATEAALKMLQDQFARVVDLISKPKEDTGVAVMSKLVDDEANRINAIRASHDSELRQLREFHSQEVSKIRDQHGQEMTDLRRSHEREAIAIRESAQREVATVQSSATNMQQTLQVAHEARLDALKGRIEDLNRQLVTSQAELVELRAKKDVPMEEQLQKFAGILSMAKELGMGGGGEAAEESLGERILNKVVENPLVEAIAARVAQGPAAPMSQPMPMPQQRPMRPRPPQPANPAQRAARQTAAQGVPAQPSPAEPKAIAEKAVAIDPEHLRMAITFLEAKYAKEAEPMETAQNASALIPPGILALVRQQGVDTLLAAMAQLQPDSPLVSQGGKSFVRKVAKCLL